MCFSRTEMIGMKFGINHARTTHHHDLEIIISGHHLINDEFPAGRFQTAAEVIRQSDLESSCSF